MIRTPRPTEHQSQAALIQWSRFAAVELPALRWLHSIPNGGRRDGATAAAMQREGVTAGVADLFLPTPAAAKELYINCHYHGCYIEMKTAVGKQSPEQKAFEQFVTEQGYRYVLARSWVEAAVALLDYLGATEEQKRRLV